MVQNLTKLIEGKFYDPYTKNICNIKDVMDVTAAIAEAFIKRQVSPIIQSLARGYITRKELEKNIDGGITPIAADIPAVVTNNAVGHAAKELERRNARDNVRSQLE